MPTQTDILVYKYSPGIPCVCSEHPQQPRPMRLEYMIYDGEVRPYQLVCIYCGQNSKSIKGKFKQIENLILLDMSGIPAPWGAKADACRRVMRQALIRASGSRE